MEQIEQEQSPAMFRNHPIGFIGSIILIPIYGIGLIILLSWWLECKRTKLTITNKKTTLRTGLLSKNTNEVYHSDVRNIRVSQGPLQRMLGVGKIGISSAGQSDFEIEVGGIQNPEKVKALVSKYRE